MKKDKIGIGNLLPLNGYFIVTIDEDEMFKGNLGYIKQRISFISIEESFAKPTYFQVCCSGEVLPIQTELIPGFVGIYHESEIGDDEFICHLELAFNNL